MTTGAMVRLPGETMQDWLNRIGNRADNWHNNHVRGYIKWLKPAEGVRILDLGTYMGANLQWWAWAGHECVGVDASTEFHRRFEEDRQRHPNKNLMSYVCCMIEDYVPDRSFHLCTCGEVLQYTTDPSGILSKAMECLVPRGELFITVPAIHFPVFPRTYSHGELEKEVELSGFCVCNCGLETFKDTVPQYWVHARKPVTA